MSSNQLLFILPVVLAFLLMEIGANPPYDYMEGEYGQGDAVFANCTINIKGTVGARLQLTAPFITSTKGAFITYIRVDNLKPKDQQGTISKTGGGVRSSSVTFNLLSVSGHGLLFQFYIYGRTPLGTSENPLIGSCMAK